MKGRKMAPWIQLVSIAVDYRSAAAARRDSSVDVSSSQSNQRGFQSYGEGLRWEEANRSLWPNSEVHEEFLPAMPVPLSSGVQNKNNTTRVRLAMRNSPRHYLFSGGSVRKRTEQSTDEQQGAAALREPGPICMNLVLDGVGTASARVNVKLLR
jgi:hypothetical protein